MDTEVLRQRARSNLVHLHVTKALLDETDLKDACVLNSTVLSGYPCGPGGRREMGEEERRKSEIEGVKVLL